MDFIYKNWLRDIMIILKKKKGKVTFTHVCVCMCVCEVYNELKILKCHVRTKKN